MAYGLGVHQLMMFCEHDFSVSNHYMQRVSDIKHPDVLALLFCTSERRALTGFLTAHCLTSCCHADGSRWERLQDQETLQIILQILKLQT